MSRASQTFSLHLSEETMGILDYFCDSEIDIRFEVSPSLLAASWIARWAIAPMTPGMAFLDRPPLLPLTVTLVDAPLDTIMTYAHAMERPPEIVASAVVNARGAQIAWFRRTNPLGKGIPEPRPPQAGA